MIHWRAADAELLEFLEKNWRENLTKIKKYCKKNKKNFDFFFENKKMKMMNLKQFEQIVQQIRGGAPCPKCKKLTKNPKIEIKKVDENLAQFGVQCPHCSAKFFVSAQIEKIDNLEKLKKIVPPPKNLENENQKIEKISAEKIFKIAEKIKNFRGKNVNELF